MSKSNLPNFLIVGAAKSGTTSLYHYLKQHPDIFIPERKECRFFSDMPGKYSGPGDEIVNNRIIKDISEYKSLFSSNHEKKARGDISPDYLYFYKKSINNIKKYLGSQVKIIIILRNPVERAFSQYLHFFRDNREVLSFEEALRSEEQRRQNNWEWAWRYKDVGFYYNQVKAYNENFSNIKIYLYGDLTKDPLTLLKNLCLFLEVNHKFIPDISKKYNVSFIPKSNLVHNFLNQPNVIKNILKPFLKPFLSDKQLGELVENAKMINLYKPKMKKETRKHLIDIYREDILKLQDLIKRDLSHWLK